MELQVTLLRNMSSHMSPVLVRASTVKRNDKRWKNYNILAYWMGRLNEIIHGDLVSPELFAVYTSVLRQSVQNSECP